MSDPGLQPERTALAWRRTGLSMGVGALVAMRLLPPHIGVSGYLAGAVAALAALATMSQSQRSRRHAQYAMAADLRGERQNPLPVSRFGQIGVVVAVTASSVTLLGLLGITLVLDLALSTN